MVPVDGWLKLRFSELAGCARSVRTDCLLSAVRIVA